MKYTGRNQAIFDLDRFSRHDMPGPFRMVIHKFSRYAETVESLPLLERMKLVLVTDFVVESFLPGNLPIMSIQLIGHADTDPQREKREPGFVQRISKRRADVVLSYLKKDVGRPFYGGDGVWIVGPRRAGPTPDKIDWVPSGVGASDPAEENRKRKKTHANMTEQDRELNRRVEIVLEPGNVPIPNANEWVRVFIDNDTSRYRPLPSPQPSPPSTTLPPEMWDPELLPKPGKPEWFVWYEKTKDWFKLHHMDIGPFLDALKNVTFQDNQWPLNEDFLKDLKRRGFIPGPRPDDD